ncbi:hypothetical protein COCNU_scaffold010472G000010 [Cocos nucifera]|nr:hypothetical protein [Cocos nucifera]
MASATTDAAPKVRPRDEVIPTAHAIVAKGESLLPEPENLLSKDRALDAPMDKEKERRKRKAAIIKKARKVHPDEPGRGSSKDQGVDPFGNPNIIQDLIDRFVILEDVDCLANLDQSNLFIAVRPPHACPPQKGKSHKGGGAEGSKRPSS